MPDNVSLRASPASLMFSLCLSRSLLCSLHGFRVEESVGLRSRVRFLSFGSITHFHLESCYMDVCAAASAAAATFPRPHFLLFSPCVCLQVSHSLCAVVPVASRRREACGTRPLRLHTQAALSKHIVECMHTLKLRLALTLDTKAHAERERRPAMSSGNIGRIQGSSQLPCSLDSRASRLPVYGPLLWCSLRLSLPMTLAVDAT